MKCLEFWLEFKVYRMQGKSQEIIDAYATFDLFWLLRMVAARFVQVAKGGKGGIWFYCGL